MHKMIVLLTLSLTGYALPAQVIPGGPTGGKLHVAIRFAGLGDTDTLSMQLYSRFFPALEDAGMPGLVATKNKEGYFCFSLKDVARIGYFSIQRNGNGLQPDGLSPVHLFEAGDSIVIGITRLVSPPRDYYPQDRYSYTYGGRGSYKYAVEDRLDSLMTHASSVPPDLIDPAGHVHDQWLGLKDRALAELATHTDSLPPAVAGIFAADIRFANGGAFFYSIRDRLQMGKTQADSVSRALTRFHLLSGTWDWERGGDQWDSALYWSKSFGYYAKAKWNFLSWLTEGETNPDWIFGNLCQKYASPVRDRLILSFFLNNDCLPRDMRAAYHEAERLVEDPYCKDALALMQFKIASAPAYDINLVDSAGQMHRLSDFSGKPVLIDVWFTGCGGCAMLYKNVLKDIEGEEGLKDKITFLSISLDTEGTQWHSGVSSGLYTGPHTVNLYTGGMGLKHPFVRHYRINTFPTLILVDGNQRIVRYNSADLFKAASLRQLLYGLAGN